MRLSNRPVTAGLCLCLAVTLALALRVVPSHSFVFSAGMVNFQESDAWYHVRTVHNLLAHFPYRSGFDPYALYPGGQDVPTGPAWDYLLASVAWSLGLGAPSAALTDAVAAWLPALLGAVFPIPVFFLARRLFGDSAGCFAALWIAAGNGALLWVTHLGLADHHAAEGLFALVTLVCLCFAIEGPGNRFAWWAGAAMGLFLATRPAGVFVPAILACMVLLEPLAAPAILRAVLAATAVFQPAAGSVWSDFAFLALAVTGALAACVGGLNWLALRRNWPLAVRVAAPFLVVIAGSAIVLMVRPHLWGSLWFEILRVAGFTPASRVVASVQEMQPVYRAGPQPGWRSVFQALGSVWVAALPVLVWLATVSFRKGRPALKLLTLWSAVMAIAAILQVRMAIYLLPVCAVLAGAACAWLVKHGGPVRRWVSASAMVAAILAVNLPWSLGQMSTDQGLPSDWLQALTWLRRNSSEPVDTGAWERYYGRVRPGETPPAAGKWGVAVWWDDGYAVEQIAHRIPMANGTQSGIEAMARFYTDTIPESAMNSLRQAGARYVIVDPLAPLFAGVNNSRFPIQVQLLGRNLDGYVQVLAERTNAGANAVPVYLPTYYQTMAARLYLSDGEAVPGAGGPWVFETSPAPDRHGQPVEVIVATHHFDSEEDAGRFLDEHRYLRLTYGCLDPGKSCVSVAAVHGLKRVFSSDPMPVSKGRPVRAVKIFEVLPE